MDLKKRDSGLIQLILITLVCKQHSTCARAQRAGNDEC